MVSRLHCTASALALAGCLAGAGAVAQDKLATFDLSTITFADGAQATGSFVLDATTDQLVSWDILVSAGKVGGALVPAQTFDSALKGASAQVSHIGPLGHDVVFYSGTSGRDYLNLFFSGSLFNSAGFDALRPALSFDSVLTSRGLRLIVASATGNPGASPQVSPVPEPSTAMLVLAGGLVMSTTLRRRVGAA